MPTENTAVNLADLLQRWEAFDAQPFPADHPELRSFETFAAMTFAKFIQGDQLDMRDVQLLWHCRDGLAKALGQSRDRSPFRRPAPRL